MKALNVIKKVIDTAMEWICIIILGIMTVLVTYQVITRFIFDDPSAISETLAQYLFVWLVMIGGAYVFGLRDHLSITVLKDRLSPVLNFVTEILIYLTLIAFSVLVCFYGGGKMALGQMTAVDAALQIPRGYIYMAVPFCGAIMTFYSVYNLFLAYEEYRHGIKRVGDDTAGTM